MVIRVNGLSRRLETVQRETTCPSTGLPIELPVSRLSYEFVLRHRFRFAVNRNTMCTSLRIVLPSLPLSTDETTSVRSSWTDGSVTVDDVKSRCRCHLWRVRNVLTVVATNQRGWSAAKPQMLAVHLYTRAQLSRALRINRNVTGGRSEVHTGLGRSRLGLVEFDLRFVFICAYITLSWSRVRRT